MTNPHLIEINYGRVSSPKSPGGKTYHAVFGRREQGRRSGKSFKTAGMALAYGRRVIIRWRRLYDAAKKLEAAG